MLKNITQCLIVVLGRARMFWFLRLLPHLPVSHFPAAPPMRPLPPTAYSSFTCLPPIRRLFSLPPPCKRGLCQGHAPSSTGTWYWKNIGGPKIKAIGPRNESKAFPCNTGVFAGLQVCRSAGLQVCRSAGLRKSEGENILENKIVFGLFGCHHIQ